MKRTFLIFLLMFTLIAANACKKSREKGIFSSGQVTIRNTWACDLDLGVEPTDNSTVDFEWGNRPPHYLEPANGAKFFVVGIVDLGSLEYDALTGYALSPGLIWVSSLPVGEVVAGITNQGRYAKFRIDANADDLVITWVTYEL